MEKRWENFFEKKHDLEYKPETMYQMLANFAKKYPNDIAYEFMGKKTKYSELISKIEITAKALTSIGIHEGDVVTICMPNCPQAIDTFYALNRIGAISNMVHPLSAQGELTFFLNFSNSKAVLTIDQFYEKVAEAREECDHQVIIIMAQIQDELPLIKSVAYSFTNGSKYRNLPNAGYSITWKNFISAGKQHPLPLPKNDFVIDRVATILYSGGTTGTTKGIMLSDLNMNSVSIQSIVAMDIKIERGMKVLSAMPLFHGFGLAIGIHTCITNGICCSLMPQFSVKTYGKALLEQKPNFIAGVPTLYEALLRTKGLENADLSFLKGMYSGGDSISIELKRKVDTFLKEHNASIQVCEGYGATECVTASCLTPRTEYREGSIGLPYPDMKYKICEPGTTNEVETGKEGEICIAGPSIMLGYLNNPEETAITLIEHPDGDIYLHTGDLGIIDKDGFVYFKQRIKRMIISSGYNIYPSQVENIIDGHPKVLFSCVIGVKDSYKMQKVKAFVVLKPGIVPDDTIKQEILKYCSKRIAKYSMPYDIEFREELPRTKVNKIAYRVLEEEENAKVEAAEKAKAEKAANEAETNKNNK